MNTRLIPYLSLTIAMVLWASTFIFMKYAFASYDPMVVLFGRNLVATLCALCIPFTLKNIHLRVQDLKYLGGMLLFEPCLYFIFEAQALAYTSASQAAMISTMMPLSIAIGAWMFLGEKLTIKTLAGFVMAVTGGIILSLASPSDPHAPNPILGNFLELLAMICGAGYSLCLKKLTDQYSPLFLTFLQALTGTIFFFFALFLPGVQVPETIFTLSAWPIVYLGIGATLGAYGLYNYGVSKIPAGQAAAFINLIPVFALIMGALILGERFTLVQYAASLAVLAGVFLTQAKKSSTSGRAGDLNL